MPSPAIVAEAGEEIYGSLIERSRPSAAEGRYRLDPFAHLEDGHVKIFDIETLEEIPFEPFEHQIEVVRSWVDLDHLAKTGRAHPELAELRFFNALAEKSRQMGITWIVAWVIRWALGYFPVRGLALHLDLDEIDDGGVASTIDSLFGKIRYLNDSMPTEWRAPLRYRMRPSIIRNMLDPLSFVVGEGATPNPGRGGKYHYGFLDEAARIAFGESVHASLSRSIPHGRLYNSTPEGEGNVYYRLASDRPAGYRFTKLHWSIHPVFSRGLHVAASIEEPRPAQPSPEAEAIAKKCRQCAGSRRGVRWTADAPDKAHRYPGKLTSDWYEEAIVELTDQQVAAELDIDYEASLTARVYPEFSEQAHVLPEGIAYDENYELTFGIDYGLDVTAILVLQETPSEVRAIAELEMGSETTDGREAIPENVVPALVEVLAAKGVPLLLLEKEWLLQMLGVGDPSGEGRDLATGKPLSTHYRRLGLRIYPPRRFTVWQTVNATKRLFLGRPKRFYVSGPDCPSFVRHAKGNRWVTDKTGRRTTPARLKDDEHNHIMRALAYWTAYRFPPEVEDETGDAVAQAAAREGRPLREGNVPVAVDRAKRDEGGVHAPGLRPGMNL